MTCTVYTGTPEDNEIAGAGKSSRYYSDKYYIILYTPATARVD